MNDKPIKTGNQLTESHSGRMTSIIATINETHRIYHVDPYANNIFDMEKERKQGIISMLTIIMMGRFYQKQIHAKLGMPRTDGPFCKRAQTIHNAIFRNSHNFFNDIDPMILLELQDNIDELAKRIKAGFGKKIKGYKGPKETAKTDVQTSLQQVLGFVNILVARNQKQGIEIIQSAALLVAGSAKQNKPDFRAFQIPGLEGIFLECLAAKIDGKYVRATYEWQYSIATGDHKIWIPMPSNGEAKTELQGIGSAVKIIFRRRINTKKGGITDWLESNTLVTE